MVGVRILGPGGFGIHVKDLVVRVGVFGHELVSTVVGSEVLRSL